jgi:hypothetical protein
VRGARATRTAEGASVRAPGPSAAAGPPTRPASARTPALQPLGSGHPVVLLSGYSPLDCPVSPWCRAERTVRCRERQGQRSSRCGTAAGPSAASPARAESGAARLRWPRKTIAPPAAAEDRPAPSVIAVPSICGGIVVLHCPRPHCCCAAASPGQLTSVWSWLSSILNALKYSFRGIQRLFQLLLYACHGESALGYCEDQDQLVPQSPSADGGRKCV